MVQEVLRYLNPSPGMVIADATAGTGGHTGVLLERILPGGRVIALDRDRDTLEVCRRRLRGYGEACTFVHANYADIDKVLESCGLEKIDALLFDLGISSFQLDDPERGFSFQAQGPLDMRLDRTSYISASDLLNNLTEKEISTILRNFGQERWHARIARNLVRQRQHAPLATTTQLAELVIRSIPARYRRAHYRIHPATRTFQAVRIAVNRELETLELSLRKALGLLKPEGVICVISFHSLEDRIVKQVFRQQAREGEVEILTPKPLTPLPAQVQENPRARSSKLRAVRRICKGH